MRQRQTDLTTLEVDYPADSQHFKLIDPWARRRC
jgi:hypothetical protein